MAYEKKDGQGTLFRNDRKEKDTHPDWAGYIIIGGVEYWLNGWEKNGAKGLFFSLAAKPKLERAAEIRGGYQGKETSYAEQKQAHIDNGGRNGSFGEGNPCDFDDEIPF